MEINMIVAAGKDGAIGKEGDLIWHLPGDLKRFKELTVGHPVIMGRKTWESLPKKPLPGRRNIVLTRQKDYSASGAEIAHSVEEALSLCDKESPFIIGGEGIYRLFLPSATRIYLTEVDATCEDADARLDLNINSSEWETINISEPENLSSDVKFRYVDYKRR